MITQTAVKSDLDFVEKSDRKFSLRAAMQVGPTRKQILGFNSPKHVQDRDAPI